MTSLPETSLARIFARQIIPWATLLVLGSGIALGYFTYRTVDRSFEPELANRAQLIGAVANANIQRAVSAGVPLESLVGAEDYFAELLEQFPEISYFGISTGRIIFESGTRQASVFGVERSRKNAPAYPIISDGKQLGYIIVDANPAYFALQFRDVLLDLGVIVLVVILLSSEVTAVLLSRSLTAPFDRLLYLVGLQAGGDFSKRIPATGRNAVDRLGAYLSARSELLHRAFTRAYAGAAAPERTAELGRRFQLHCGRPQMARFSYLNDVRLPLFLFAAADELPLSFFPVFTRTAENPLAWLDITVVMSLPLAGYIVAIMIASPYARPLAERFGHRNLVLMAIVPTLLAHLGLAFSANVLEIVFFRTAAGFGYAIVTLVCQDYVLDLLPKEQRARSLGYVTAAMFGGIFAGTALGGILADRLGPSVVFMVSAGLVFASGLLTLHLVPGGRRARTSEAAHPAGVVPALAAMLGSHRFMVLVLGIAIPANVVLQAFICYLVALELNALGATASDTGRILMLYFLMVALVGPLAGRIDRRIDPAVVSLGGAVLSGAALLVPMVWPSMWSILFAVAGVGIGHGMVRGPQVAVAMDIAESELGHIGANAVLGALRTIERGGSVLGLIGLALASSVIGYTGAIGAAAVWVLVGAAIFAVFHGAAGGFLTLRSRPT